MPKPDTVTRLREPRKGLHPVARPLRTTRGNVSAYSADSCPSTDSVFIERSSFPEDRRKYIRSVATRSHSSSPKTAELMEDDLAHEDAIHEVIDNRWRLGALLGKGGFGTVFEARDVVTGTDLVMKLQSEKKAAYQEILVLDQLQNTKMSGFPYMHGYGTYGKFEYIILTRLGESFENILRDFKPLARNFIMMFGIQAITLIEKIHSIGYIHSDIKPDNFMVGLKDPGRVYILDFGLSRRFVDYNGMHVPKYRVLVRGTDAFNSPSVNFGWEHSRRDDLVSLGYSIIYMLESDYLPWLHITAGKDLAENAGNSRPEESDSDTCRDIAQMQIEIPLPELCRTMPRMETFFRYVEGLKYEAKPDYDYVREIIFDCLSIMDADNCRG